MSQTAMNIDPVAETRAEVTRWSKRLQELQGAYNETQAELERLRGERGKTIAEGGNRGQLERLESEFAQASRRQRELAEGIEHAEQRLEEARAADAEAGREARDARVRSLASEREKLARQVDERLQACARDLARMVEIGQQIRAVARVKDASWHAYFPGTLQERFGEHLLRRFEPYIPGTIRLGYRERFRFEDFVRVEAEGYPAYLEGTE